MSRKRLEHAQLARDLAGERAALRLRRLHDRAGWRSGPPSAAPPSDAGEQLRRAAWTVRRVGVEEGEEAREARRRRWMAVLLRQAYSLDWVPESVVANITRIEVRPQQQAVVLTLRGGTRLVDRCDRIDVVGLVNEVAVHELVEAVRRRGWAAVEVHGPESFRHAAAALLRAGEPPIVVVNVLDLTVAKSMSSTADDGDEQTTSLRF